MKKMKKLFFSVFALSALILSACSGHEASDTSSTPSSSSQTPTTSVTPSESSEPEESSIPEESSSAEEESSSQEGSSSEPIPSYADFRMEIGNAVYDLELFEDTETIKQYYFGEDVSKTVAAGESIAFKKRANDAYSAFDVAPSPDDYSSWIYNNVEGDEDEGYTIKAAGDVQVYLKEDKTTSEWSFWISGGGSIPKPDAGYYLCGNNIGENWNLDAEYMLAKETDPEQPNTYFINYTAIQGDEFKICEVKEDGSKVWWPHKNDAEELQGYYKNSETAQSAIHNGYLAGAEASNLATIVPGEYRIDIDTSDHGIWTSLNEDADHNPKRTDLIVGLVGHEEYEAPVPFGTLAAGGYKYSVNVPLSALTLDDIIYVRWADDSDLVIELDDAENPSIEKYFKVNADLTLSLKELSTKTVDIVFALQSGKMVASADEAPVLNDVTFRVKMDASDLDVYVAGDFNEWNKTAIKLNETDATNHIYSVTAPIYTGAYEYKFVKGETYEYDGVADSNRQLVVADEMTTPVYIFNSQEVFSISTFYLCGNNIGEDWGIDSNYQLIKEADPEQPNTYYINYTAVQGGQFKICEVLEDGTKIWWPNVNESEQVQGYYKSSETAQSAIYRGYLYVTDELNLGTVVPGEYRIDIDLSDHGIWTSININEEKENRTQLLLGILDGEGEPVPESEALFPYFGVTDNNTYKYYAKDMPTSAFAGQNIYVRWKDNSSTIIEIDESAEAYFEFDEETKIITGKTGLVDQKIEFGFELLGGKMVLYAKEMPVVKSVTFRVKMDASDLDVYVAGDFNNWSKTANKLTETDSTNHIYSTSTPIELEVGEYEFKFVNGETFEFENVPDSNRPLAVADEMTTPVYIFNSNDIFTTSTLYLRGTFTETGWALDKNYAMTLESANQYSITKHFNVGDQIKVFEDIDDSENDLWYPRYEQETLKYHYKTGCESAIDKGYLEIEKNQDESIKQDGNLIVKLAGTYTIELKNGTDDPGIWTKLEEPDQVELTVKVGGNAIDPEKVQDIEKGENLAAYQVTLAANDVISFYKGENAVHFFTAEGETAYTATADGKYNFYFNASEIMFVAAPVTFKATSSTVEPGWSVYLLGDFNKWKPSVDYMLTLNEGVYSGTYTLSGGDHSYKYVEIADSDTSYSTIYWEKYTDAEHDNNRIINVGNTVQVLSPVIIGFNSVIHFAEHNYSSNEETPANNNVVVVSWNATQSTKQFVSGGKVNLIEGAVGCDILYTTAETPDAVKYPDEEGANSTVVYKGVTVSADNQELIVFKDVDSNYTVSSSTKAITFKVTMPNEEANTVYLAGDFTNWQAVELTQSTENKAEWYTSSPIELPASAWVHFKFKLAGGDSSWESITGNRYFEVSASPVTVSYTWGVN